MGSRSTDTAHLDIMSTTPLIPAKTLSAPKRRDVKALTAALAETKTGDQIVALFRDDRYGVYQVVGKVGTSCAYDGPVLAGIPLGQKGRPAASLVALGPYGPGAAFAAKGSQVDLGTMTHGDLLTAWFSAEPWGAFTVTGHVVALGADALMLGGLLLRTGSDAGVLLRGGLVLDRSLSTCDVPPHADIVIDAA